MIKYYNGLNKMLIQEQADIVFREVSSGIYFIEKDRLGKYYDDFINTDNIIYALISKYEKVTVIGINGTYSNF